MSREILLPFAGKRASTVKFLIEKSQSGELSAEIPAVIFNDVNSPGIQVVKDLGVKVELVISKNFKNNPEALTFVLNKKVRKYNPRYISLNGSPMILPDEFIEDHPDEIVNQHGGPQDETKGMFGLQLAATTLNIMEETGRNEGFDVSILGVIPRIVDGGPKLAVTNVPILEGDTAETLADRAIHYEWDQELDFWNAAMNGDIKEITEVHHYLREGDDPKILVRARAKARRDFPTSSLL